MFKNNTRQTEFYRQIPFLILLLFFIGFTIGFTQKISWPKSPWEGREVFHKKGCIQCHAINGSGGEDGPDLGKEKFYGTYLELAALMWNHFPKMFEKMQKTDFQFPELDQEEMKQLIAYLSYMRYMGESTGRESKGRKLLKNKGCVLCHEFGGLGGDIGPDITAKKEYLTPMMLAESMWNHGPNMMELFQEHNIERPEFEDDEIVDLANGIRSYMRSTKVPLNSHYLGDPVQGKKIAEKKGCMLCHSFRGVGGELGPDFADVDFNYSVIQIAGKMWNHGQQMWEMMISKDITFPVFKSGEMVDVISYMYSLKLEDDPGDAEKGHQIVINRGCLSCHSLRGKGAEISIDLATLDEMASPLVMITAMWNHAPAMQEKLLQTKVKRPVLNGKDMANLYAYLNSLSMSSKNKK